MNKNLNIAVIQTDIVWESPIENLTKLTQEISKIESSVELIVLPEMFATGFTINAKVVSQTMEGEIVLWMKETAISKEAAIYGSVIIEENSKFYNRGIFIYPDGEIEYYDKKHLFSLAGEDTIFSSGEIRKIITYKGWRIMPLVCYDLRFPVWSRNDLNYDLLIYIASWPEKRINAWQTLLKARAIENMSYVIGVNRVGTDGNNYKYSGGSVVINELGDEILTTPKYGESIKSIDLDIKPLQKSRNHLAFLNDKDLFDIKNLTTVK